jgi:hypothetical protein
MSDRTVGASTSPTAMPSQTSMPTSSSGDDYWPEPTMWVGWIAFAGTMMLLVGCFHAIQGLVAIFDDQYFLVGQNNLVVHVDYTTWGWVHLIAGIIMALAGVAVMRGQMWARIVAVAVAFLSCLLNIAFLSAYPIWSTIMIAVDILVIWAVIVHGREVRAPTTGDTY